MCVPVCVPPPPQNNPVLIGEPGVGKTAVVEGVAQRIVSGDVPEGLAHMKVVSLDMGALVGTVPPSLPRIPSHLPSPPCVCPCVCPCVQRAPSTVVSLRSV